MSTNESSAFPTTLVDVGGYKLALACAGSGSPTVIFDAGMGDTHEVWREVQEAVSQFTQACSYDRAGRGLSDGVPASTSKPRTSQTIVTELHTLLLHARVPSPYVLVGHSFGGLNARLFASQYPEEVAGLVLVDSASNNRDLVALLPAEAPDESEGIRQARRVMTQETQTTGNPEGIDPVASAAQVQAVTSLGNMPLMVLTRSSDPWIDMVIAAFPGFPRELALKLEDDWQQQQRQLLLLSSQSEQVIAHQSGHYIHRDEPDVVVRAVRSIVEVARRSFHS